jgi:glycosyltransferase involved in cell wall biosynthesis
MIADDIVTAISVTWNTKELIQRAIESIRQFHPSMKIIIVDGSENKNACYAYLNSIDKDNIKVYHMDYNIGHGRGMHFGVLKCTTPFVLFFDSDIEMVKSPLQGMLDMMESNTYGVGYLERVGPDGHDYGVFEHHKKHSPVKYLHPYFQLVQVKEYKKYHPYIHHGAPCVSAMLDIHKKGLSDVVLKEFPGLGHTNGQGVSWNPVKGEYIKHDVAGFGGTGRMRVQAGMPHIEGAWEKVIR